MTLRTAIARFTQHEDVNFLLTNRIPRRWLTIFIGWLSKVENPIVRETCITLWKLFSDLDLSEAKKTRFKSVHECFTRELKDGARPVDHSPEVIVSPCDAIVGAHGKVTEGMLLQAKGFPYSLRDLLDDPQLIQQYRNGTYVTLRLTSSMYHRFHAPYDCRVERVTYISGDTWNVNPIALRRVENLFCKNERAVIRCRLQGNGPAHRPSSGVENRESSGHSEAASHKPYSHSEAASHEPHSHYEAPGADRLITLVPVAAILVASIRLHFLDVLLHLRYRGANVIPCNAAMKKGQEMGWFQHGSTIIVFAPEGVGFADGVHEGGRIKMGEPLLRLR